MSKGYFTYTNPRHLLEKAKRGYEKMISGLMNTDKVFNFFVTAWAIKDYIESQGIVDNSMIIKLYDDEDFKKCQYLCNKGKHLNKRLISNKQNLKNQKKFKNEIFESTFGGAPIDELAIADDNKYVIITDHLSVDVKILGRRIIDKWEAFFQKHSI